MPILIRDEHFEKRADQEKGRRKHKSLAKTVTELASERMNEISSGAFIPPFEVTDAHPRPTDKNDDTRTGQSAASAA